jgi:endonuclease YncB( thermonuclease family)
MWLLAAALSTVVVSVSDGDTLAVRTPSGDVRVRLEGIDCPEKHQPHGLAARWFVRSRVFVTRPDGRRSGKTVSVDERGRDRNGRRIARVRVDGRDLSLELLRAGFAWHYRRYNHEPALAQLEADARTARRGLWADPRPTPPWEWRRRRRH